MPVPNNQQVNEWLELMLSSYPESWTAEIREEVLRQIEEMPESRDNIRLVLKDGRICGATTVFPLSEELHMLAWPVLSGLDEQQLTGLFSECAEHSRNIGASRLFLRMETILFNDVIKTALGNAGFECVGERIECVAPVEVLPSEDESSPFSWKNLGELGEQQVFDVLTEVVKGDPSAENESPEMLVMTLQMAFGDPNVYREADCCEIGFIEGNPAAIALAQVHLESRSSRITYMGLLPQFRGRGLGRQLQRRCFDIIRRQGGMVYEGGVDTRNEAMLHMLETLEGEMRGPILDWFIDWSADEP